MINLITKDKYQGEGRPFGTTGDPIKYLLVLLTDDGTIPDTYEDVENLEECVFAPGSILLDTDGKKTYIYNGEEFVEWT